VAERLPREEWTALIPNAHVGYITWEDFEENQRRLRENAQANGADRRRSPPREGPALLQGLAVCGICGDRMTVRYHRRQGTAWPTYVCQRRGIAQAEPICQSIPGRGLDHAIGRVLLETVTPLTLEITLTVCVIEQRAAAGALAAAAYRSGQGLRSGLMLTGGTEQHRKGRGTGVAVSAVTDPRAVSG
jgi:hypothetical protein